MCGIAGQLNRPNGASVSTRDLRRMCDAIVHRGPDDEGILVDGTFGMGMRRLGFNELTISNRTLKKLGGSPMKIVGGFKREECVELLKSWKRLPRKNTY